MLEAVGAITGEKSQMKRISQLFRESCHEEYLEISAPSSLTALSRDPRPQDENSVLSGGTGNGIYLPNTHDGDEAPRDQRCGTALTGFASSTTESGTKVALAQLEKL